MDTFCVDVAFVNGEGAFTSTPRTVSVSVLAATTNDAVLAAMEMVACTGRTPVSATIDWDNF